MLHRAAQAIRDCEGRLRGLIAEASATGDYDSVEQIAAWARSLALMTPHLTHPIGTIPVPSEDERNEFGKDWTEQQNAASNPVSPLRPRRPTAKKATYPKFSRQRSELVKTGWSKKEKQEYQHRAPWAVVEVLASQISQRGGGTFTSEDIFPLTDPQGVEIPSYQAYLCLAWLKTEGLIVQDGRQGYYATVGSEVLTSAQSLWEQMA